jgi:hypothetical protein
VKRRRNDMTKEIKVKEDVFRIAAIATPFWFQKRGLEKEFLPY